ncbi:hypothetical protein BKA65DRAFT_46654 [Rhexocercosporidium sp. MPI-PUGE-AT-0058]|nr:hypothetical protein BKA65DRAFT_46654 [Rhexocercosporidium sp. MPI-PUGE-AT-0058]
MRSVLVAFLASAAIVSATGCAQNNLDDLVARISCGTKREISKCLHTDIDLTRLEEIEDCLVSGGCSMADATAEAVWFTFDCRAGQGELKKRQNDETTTEKSTTEEETTTKKTTSKTTSAKKTTTTAPSSTEATTTSESTTEPTTSTSSATSTTPTTASSTTSTSSSSLTSTSTATAQSASITGGPLVCSVTTTKSTSQCIVSRGKTQSCVATTIELASCAPGMICFSARPGSSSCMKRDNSLKTSGLVVAIAFGVGLAATAIAVIAMVIHGKNKVKAKQQAQLLAAASSRSGRGGDVEAAKAFTRPNPMASDATIPLITPGGQRSDQANYSQQEYFVGGQGTGRLTPPEYRGAGSSGSGSSAPPVPRLELHQGLGTLGQNPRY